MDNCPDLSPLEVELGQIQVTKQIYPGIYYLLVTPEHDLFATEYYAVTDTPIISREAKAYGRRVSDWWLFSMQEDASGWRIIDYELGKYCVKNQFPLEQPLHDIALDAAEYHPEYFGTYPVPFSTPRGYTTRHWTLANGIYWIETDQCEEVLAVCYPVWSSELSDLAKHVGEQAEYDKIHGIEETLGYIFFPQQVSSIPVYELMQTRPEWEGHMIDKAALMNAIWKYIPEYAIIMNQREQTGTNNVIAMLLMQLGIEAEPRVLSERMVSISSGSGENYLLFKR